MTQYTDITKPGSSSLYSAKEILARGDFTKTHLYNLLKRGQFPQPALRCGSRFTRWSSADVDAWFADPAGWIAAHAKREAAHVE